jgi:glycosyltransferase involved in cell wall biosynthesis
VNSLVSVIIPSYNHARFLAEAVESVRAQTYPHWECLIIDDGSTDKTADIANRFVERDARIRYLSQSNRGVSAARNRGLDEAHGALVQFLDADDVILPEKLELQLSRRSAADELSVFSCGYRYSMSESVMIDDRRCHYLRKQLQAGGPVKDLAANWETGLSIPCHCFLFDARFFTEHGIRFDERLPNHEDWDCWMNIFSRAPRYQHLDEPLAVYRVSETSMSRNRKAMRRGFLRAVKKQLRLQKSPDIRSALQKKREQIKVLYYDCTWSLRVRAKLKRFHLRKLLRLASTWPVLRKLAP